MLARRLVKAPDGGLFTDKGIAWLEHVELDPLDRALIDADLRLLEAIAKQSTAIDVMIVNESYEDPDVQLLMTLPGVDYTVRIRSRPCSPTSHAFPSPTRPRVIWNSCPA